MLPTSRIVPHSASQTSRRVLHRRSPTQPPPLHAYIYRGLVPENILLNHGEQIKIIEVGFAKFCPNMTRTSCGAPDYLAPETVCQQQYNKQVDLYALGVLIYEMLNGLPPYNVMRVTFNGLFCWK